MTYEIKGGTFPIVEVKLNTGEKVTSEAGAMCWRSPSFTIETTSNGGLKTAFSRALAGESLFMNIYTATVDNSKINFGSCVPGEIKAIELKDGESLICQKGSFLFALGNVDLSIYLNKKVGVGIFGGEGFILEKITGPGIAFLEIDGESYEYELQQYQKLVVSTGHLVSVESTCSIDVQSISGLKNIFFGGEGLFNTVITGPGKVRLQTMPVAKLARSVDPYISHPESSSK